MAARWIKWQAFGLAILCGAAIAQQQPTVLTGPTVIHAIQHDQSPPLRKLKPLPPSAETEREKPLRRVRPLSTTPAQADPVVQSGYLAPSAPATVSSFDGFGVGAPNFSVNSAPPDTNGAVGYTQYVQWVNESFGVFNKSTGALVYGPAAGNTLWQGFGGRCETDNDGDPIAQYDKIANRWILTQFAVTGGPPYYQCIAVSTTSDATGSYYRYAFQFSSFNDYPKLGVWPDAYYMSFNMFNGGTTFAGPQLCALDRNAMLTGASATQVCFQLSTSYGGLLPGDLDGSTLPPAGSPDFFLDYGTNSLLLWKFHVDFTTPANSTLTGPTSISVAAFSAACSGGGTCIPQSGTSQKLDSLADRLMYRLAYRNFGNHESLVVNQSVTANSVAAVRWYELRNPNGTPQVWQQGTYQPDSSYRWMGSIAMDSVGNMLLGYSASSSSIFPAIRYTGRLVTDTAGTMQTEGTIIDGGGSQGHSLSRWGDYSSMSVDPFDDCTFWYTTEYLKSSGTFNWSTRIATIRFPNCTSPAYMLTPLSGTTLGGTSATFTWNAGLGATQYALAIGTTPGGTDVYNQNQGTNTSASVSGLPTAGQTLYVRLSSLISGNWQFRDYTYTEFSASFAVSASPTSVSVAAGGNTTSTITITPDAGFNSAVALSASGAPSGVAVSFNPASIAAPGSGTSMMTVTAGPSTTPGSYTITATGTGGGTTHGTGVGVTVTQPTHGNTGQFVKTDTTTQGTWRGAYGADGYAIAADSASYPSYATVNVSNQTATWVSSTADVRALQNGAATGRLASAWYTFSSFTIDVNLTDGNSHQVALYALDWDSTTRTQTITVQDAQTLAVLDTRTVSGFNGGAYLVWNLTGHVTFTVTNTGPTNAVISGIFFGGAGAALPPSGTAAFVATDGATQGNWRWGYGGDGYSIAGDSASYPSYATVSMTVPTATWISPTTDVRALQNSAGTGREATAWYASSNFTIDVNLTDGQSHKLALYALDWDSTTRTQTITIRDAGTGTVLDTRNVTGFNGGLYLSWTLSGHVIFTITNTGPTNAVLSGIFFGPAGAAVPPSGAASFVASDGATQGNWRLGYGGDGYSIAGDSAPYPSYATVSMTVPTATWMSSTSDVRALQNSAGTGREATAWYASSSFTIDVNLTDGQSHEVALYALDWDSYARSQTITVRDAATGTVLDTKTVSGFNGGLYLSWMVSGHVVFNITNTGPTNAVISGIFFGGASTSGPVSSSASFVKADTTTQGSWRPGYGTAGYSIAADSASIPAFATLSIPAATALWTSSTTDVRALQNGTGTTRIASCWFTFSTYSVDLNLTDGLTHQIALYALDWDSTTRTQTITVRDAQTGTVLDTRSLSSFSNGTYLVWTVSGHVVMNVTNTGPTNAVISGIFFD